MKLLTLELHNFKKHRYLRTSFADNLTVIRGPNWAGKSSVLHGLLFALFGVSAIPGKKEDMVLWGEHPRDLLVVLETDKGTIKRSFANASVEIGAVITATGHSSVDLWVQQTFGWDKKTTLELLYSPQSETSAILTLGVPALNRLVERLSGADVAERAIKAVSARLSALPGVGDEPAILPEPDPVEPLERVAGQLEDYVKKVRTDLDAAREALQAAREALAKQAHRAKAQADLDALTPVQPPEPGKDVALKARIKEAEQDQKTILRHQELTEWFRTTGAEWERLEPNIEKAEKVKQELVEYNTQLAEARSQHRVIETNLNNLRKAKKDGVCQSCNRPFEGHNPTELDSQIETAEAELASYFSKIDILKESIKELNSMHLPVPPSDYQERYNKMAEELDNLYVPVLWPDTKPLLAELDSWERDNRAYTVYIAKRETLQATLDRAEVVEGEFDLDKLHEEKGRLEQMSSKMEREWRESRETLARVRAEHVAYERSLSTHTAWERRKRELEHKANRYQEFARWLKTFKQDALTGAWASICAQASRILVEASGGHATALLRAEDGSFTVLEQDREVPVSVVSGGMRAIAGTALKLALSRFDFLVLDEASSELNDANAAGLASALASSGKQVVLVTHREGEEYLAGQTLELAQK
jgi:DNA repair exonuclease SbcCD ATPase subunit